MACQATCLMFCCLVVASYSAGGSVPSGTVTVRKGPGMANPDGRYAFPHGGADIALVS